MVDICPSCKSNLRGEPIPAIYFVHYMEDDPNWDRSRHRSHEQQVVEWNEWLARQGRPPEDRCFCLPYGDLPEEERFGSRLIGHQVRGVYDGVLIWTCPDCRHSWPRFSPDPETGYRRLHDKAKEIIARWAFEDERVR